MTESMHDQLRDRMPEVARGSAAWTADEAAHLAACAECREELAMVTSAVRIGAGVEATFDASAAARAVTLRLTQEPVGARSRYRPLILLATAAVLALVYARPMSVPAPIGPREEARLFPELDSLSSEELTILADGLEIPLAEVPFVGERSADPDTLPLERVLRALEG